MRVDLCQKTRRKEGTEYVSSEGVWGRRDGWQSIRHGDAAAATAPRTSLSASPLTSAKVIST